MRERGSSDSAAVVARRGGVRALAALALLPLALRTPATANPAPGGGWEAESDGFEARLSPDGDLVAGRVGEAPLYSARAEARRAFRAVVRTPGVAAVPEFRVAVAPVSLAGPFLGLREEAFADNRPAAHPSGEARLRTLDLRRLGGAAATSADGAAVDLRRLVPRAAWRRALGLAAEDADDEAPRALEALAARFGRLAPGQPREFAGCFAAAADWGLSWAARSLDGGALRVALGLPGTGPCRTALTEVALPPLPTPRGWSGLALRAAPPDLRPAVFVHSTGRG